MASVLRISTAALSIALCACGAAGGDPDGGIPGGADGGVVTDGGATGAHDAGVNMGGANSVTFPLSTGAVSFDGPAFAHYRHESNQTMLRIIFVEGTGACSATTSMPTFTASPGSYKLDLTISSYGLDAKPLMPGTYNQDSLNVNLPPIDVAASAQKFVVPMNNSNCSSEQLAFRTTSAPYSITITALDEHHVAGSYSFKMEDSKAPFGKWDLSGTFDVPICASGNLNAWCM